MAWESRKGKWYYYEGQKVGGRVVKRYIGKGEFAGLICRFNDLMQQRSALESEERREERAKWDALTGAVQTLCRDTQSMVALLLTEAGYHQHDRGAWRKKRMAAPSTLTEQTKREKLVRSTAVPESQAERIALLQAGIKSEASIEAQAKAIACIRKYPNDVNIGFSDSLHTVLSFGSGGSSVLYEVLTQQAEQQRRELEGPNPTPLEKILVNRIIACEFEVAEYQRTYFSKLKQGITLPLCDSMQKRLDRAHGRHLAAIKALAQVRKLQIPTVAVAMPGSTQINMGEKQINLAQAGAGQVRCVNRSPEQASRNHKPA